LVHRLLPERDLIPVAQRLSRRTVDWKKQLAILDPDPLARLQALRLDPAALQNVQSSNKKSQATIVRYQQAWAQAVEILNRPADDFVAFPPAPTAGGQELKTAWPRALAPLEDAYLEAARLHIIQLAAAFQEFRFESGQLYFSDQIILAHRLLDHPKLRRELLSRDYRLLLDEAQDTDPLQFALLTELGRSPDSTPWSWPVSPETPPQPGRFVMVGDQQQAIYRDRASLALYQSYHEALSRPAAGEALTFSQTFRCRPAVVHFVNHIFSPLLDGQNGQAAFVPLEPRSDSGTGQTISWATPAHRGNSAQKMHHEVTWLAQKILETGLSGLRARHWGEVAILCPKRAWLLALQEALDTVHLPTQLAFEPPNHDFPEYLWLTALLTLQAEPNNEFETVGVLREIYGLSDDAIYQYRFADPTVPRPLSLRAFPGSVDLIEEHLHHFHTLREIAILQPLPEAIATWVEGTQLKQRLEALPDGARSVRRLEQIMLSAHSAVRQGLTLPEWVETLRDNLEESSAAFAPDHAEAIQLMTFQKSKGLQWDAVIVPFLGKEDALGGQSDYPKIACPPLASPQPEFKLHNGLKTSGWEASDLAAATMVAQERRRLYYVACTRARHSLILIDDANVWAEEKKQGWKLTAPNGYEALSPAFEPYHYEPTILHQTQDKWAAAPSSEQQPPTSSPSLPAVSAWPEVSSPQPVTWNRVRPSAHAPAEEMVELEAKDEEGQPALIAPFPAYALSDPVRYGLWWHDTMRASSLSLQAADLLPASLRERGAKELQAYLNSPLFQILRQARVLREIPYTRSPAPNTIEEGIIDLLYSVDGKIWTLLDWKTDLVVDPQILRQRHGAQLAAYAQALEGYGFVTPQKQIYSTALGLTVEI
jgi:ATP-dependent exoDNAse (exonuclease V) beta subunit